MKALLIVLGILVLLAMVPMGAHVRYDLTGSWAWLVLGPVKIRVFPQKEKKPGKPKQSKQKKPKPKKKKEPKKKEKQPIGGLIRDFYPFFQLGSDFLGYFFRKLRARCLTIHISFGGLDDPAAAAINYGRAWAIIGSIMPRLRRRLRIKKENVSASCDFTRGDMRLYAELNAIFLLGDLIAMVIRYGFRSLKLYLPIKKRRKEQTLSDKAVQKYEPSSS